MFFSDKNFKRDVRALLDLCLRDRSHVNFILSTVTLCVVLRVPAAVVYSVPSGVSTNSKSNSLATF